MATPSNYRTQHITFNRPRKKLTTQIPCSISLLEKVRVAKQGWDLSARRFITIFTTSRTGPLTLTQINPVNIHDKSYVF